MKEAPQGPENAVLFDGSGADLIENIVQGVVVYDSRRRLVLWNRQYERLLDVPPGLLRRDMPIAELIDFLARRGDFGEGDPERLAEARLQRLWEGHQTDDRVLYNGQDGRLYDLLFRRREDGGMVMTFTDVTDRARSEDAYRESEQRLTQILDASPYGVAIVSRRARRRLYVNARFRLMFGDDEDSLIARSLEESYENPADLDRQWALIERHGSFAGLEIRRVRIVDGERRLWWCQTDAQTLSFAGEDAIIVWHYDVTERKQAETDLRTAMAEVDRSRRDLEKMVEARTRQLHEAMERAEAANRSMGEFLANMSHELRTPLNAIMGFSEIIASAMFGPLEAKYREYAGDIRISAAHLSGIISDILDISKVEAGEIDVRSELIDVPGLLDDCRLMVRGRAEDAGIDLQFACPDNLAVLEADPLRVKQVLLNLIGNAIKFTPEGGEVTVTASNGADGGVVFEVRDTGVGIEREDIPRVLEKFGQVRGGAMQTHEGAGLGLALSKSLVERHGGALEIDSEPGRGTCVTVRFPPAHRSRDTPNRAAPAG